MPKSGSILNGKNLTLSKNDFAYYEKPIVKMVISKKYYCRFNKEKNQIRDVASYRSRTASVGSPMRNNSNPYLDPDKMITKEQSNDKSK